MAKSRLYKFRPARTEISFAEKKWWVLCNNHYKEVIWYLTFAGEQWEILRGEKTAAPCYYCQNPEGLIDPAEFELR
jgi:hypothetical protein